MKTRVGLVFAMSMEAKAILGRRNWRRIEGRAVCRALSPEGAETLGVCSGMGESQALGAAQWLIEQGVSAIAVMGVAGGLCPSLVPGDLIVADAVLEEGSDLRAATLFPDRRYAREFYRLLVAAGLPARLGKVLTVTRAAFTREEKQNFYCQSKALAVDMESAAVVRVAQEAGVPSLVLRAVCDRADRTLPAAVVHIVAESGRLRLVLLLQSLFSSPSTLVACWQLKNEFNAALTALRLGWQAQNQNESLIQLSVANQTGP